MVAISGQFTTFNALLQLQRADRNEQVAFNRLSSGERIQEAADDPTGLALADDLRSEIRALRETKRANFDGVTTIQLADENLEEVTRRLYRIAELAQQAASTTLGGDGTEYNQSIDLEYQELLREIDQTNDALRFNDITLFGSSGTTFTVNATTDQAGPVETIDLTFSSFSTTVLGLVGTDLTTIAGADNVIATVGSAIETISRQRGRLGTVQERLERNMEQLDLRLIESQDRELEIRGTSIDKEVTDLARFQILKQSNVAAIAQSNLNVDRVFQLIS
jgi:flagellin